MTPLILFALMIGIIFLLAYVLRVHSSPLFIGITSGYLLALFLADTDGYISFTSSGELNIVVLAAFTFPVILTLWLMHKSMPTNQFIVQLLPQLGNSVLFFILLYPLLPADTQQNLLSDPLARTAINAADALVVFAVVVQLVLMIVTTRPAKGD